MCGVCGCEGVTESTACIESTPGEKVPKMVLLAFSLKGGSRRRDAGFVPLCLWSWVWFFPFGQKKEGVGRCYRSWSCGRVGLLGPGDGCPGARSLVRYQYGEEGGSRTEGQEDRCPVKVKKMELLFELLRFECSRTCQRPESMLLLRSGLFRPLRSPVVMEPGELGANTREGACCFRNDWQGKKVVLFGWQFLWT